jgi:hypothetical protein
MGNIGVLDCHNHDYDHIADLTLPLKKKYCSLHGYDFISYTFGEIGRFPTWGRVLGLKKHLGDCDWILYLDTDTYLTNLEVSIEDYLGDFHVAFGVMPDFNTGKPTHISTSAILMKNSAWSLTFLDLWWKQKKFDSEPYHKNLHGSTGGYGGKFYEQSAIHFLWDHCDQCRKRIKILPNMWFNSRESNWKPGDFLIHFANQPKIPRMYKFFLGQMRHL